MHLSKGNEIVGDKMYYTGVGSRDTPPDILELIIDLAGILANRGYTLRSGAADGADKAFEIGCEQVVGKKEIYIPWKGFMGSESNLYEITPQALQLASMIHPNWDACKPGAKKLHARNTYQVLGYSHQLPSDFLVCWTKGGKFVGGTRTALVLAQRFNIPIYNLALSSDYQKLKIDLNIGLI